MVIFSKEKPCLVHQKNVRFLKVTAKVVGKREDDPACLLGGFKAYIFRALPGGEDSDNIQPNPEECITWHNEQEVPPYTQTLLRGSGYLVTGYM